MSCFILFQDFYLGCIKAVSTMDSGVTVVSDPVVTLRITSTISPFETEKRFMRSITIAEFKVSLLSIHPMFDRMHKLTMASLRLVFKKNTCSYFIFVHCDQGKLEMIVGSPASCMSLELFSNNDKFLQKIDDDDALLGSYHVDNYCKIHVSIWFLPSTVNITVKLLSARALDIYV